MSIASAGRWSPADTGFNVAVGRRTRIRRTDSYLYMRILVGVMLIVTVDFTKFLDKGNEVRYLLLMIPFGAAFLIRFRDRRTYVRRPLLGDKILLTLMLFGGVGSVVGRVFFATNSTALPIFIPMMMAFLYLLMVEDPTEHEAHKILVALGLIGLLYVFLNAVANSGVVPSLRESRTYRNAEVMYIALGFAAVVFTRHRVRAVAIGGLAGFVFLSYPSATSAIVILVTLLTFFVTRPRGTKVRFYLAGLMGVIIGVILLFNFSATVQLAGDYFSAVGKKDNSNARLALWENGIQRFGSSPAFGDAFSGETTVLVYRQEGSGAPFHNPYNNDYILFLASGGLVGFALLGAWIVWVERTALLRYRGFLASGQIQHAMLMRALLVGFNAWLTAAAFNPLFSGMGRSVTLFCLYSLMLLLGRPSHLAPDAA